MKVVYIAGKYRGPTPWDVEQNIRAAEEVAARVAAMGLMPQVVHPMTRFIGGSNSDEQFWVDGTLEIMRRCDAVVLVPGWDKSTGTRGEIAEARALGIPVFGLESGDDLDRSVPLHAAAIASHVAKTLRELDRWRIDQDETAAE